jgi:hypothetical protein
MWWFVSQSCILVCDACALDDRCCWTALLFEVDYLLHPIGLQHPAFRRSSYVTKHPARDFRVVHSHR